MSRNDSLDSQVSDLNIKYSKKRLSRNSLSRDETKLEKLYSNNDNCKSSTRTSAKSLELYSTYFDKGLKPSTATFDFRITKKENDTYFTSGLFKKFISVGVQISNEMNAATEEEIEYRAENTSRSSCGGSQLSWGFLPLTGDLEVDEEIIKFYKARYRKFKEQEK